MKQDIELYNANKTYICGVQYKVQLKGPKMAVLDQKWNIWPWDKNDLMPYNVKVSIGFSLDVDHGSGLGEVRHHPAGPGSCQEPLLQLSCRLPWMGGHVDLHSIAEHDSVYFFIYLTVFEGGKWKENIMEVHDSRKLEWPCHCFVF